MNNDFRTMGFFLVFFILFSLVRDMASQEKISECLRIMKENSYSHSLLEMTLKYNNIMSTIIAGFMTAFISVIPVGFR